MAGSVAATIQGEAGSNPANQFAVASVIYNRMQAGNFPGGGDPYAIVNAPSQFVGSATPNASAQQFADAIAAGNLSQYGTTGNATYFQTTGSNTTLGGVGYDIGGNAFSDVWGAPSSNFTAPAYGASAPAGTPGTGDIPAGGDYGGLNPDAVTGAPAVAAANAQLGAVANWLTDKGIRFALIAGGILLLVIAAWGFVEGESSA
jgi:hypothetical protein